MQVVVKTDIAQMEEAIYDESFRALEAQATALDGLANRAGTIAAVANIATAFLGGVALASGSTGGLASIEWLAVALFCLTLGTSLAILVPSTSLIFWHHPHDLLGEYFVSRPPPTLSEFRRSVAYLNGRHHDRNGVRLRRLALLLWTASVFLTVEVVLWLMILAL